MVNPIFQDFLPPPWLFFGGPREGFQEEWVEGARSEARFKKRDVPPLGLKFPLPFLSHWLC